MNTETSEKDAIAREAARYIAATFAMGYVRIWDFENDAVAGPAAIYATGAGTFHGGFRAHVVESIRTSGSASPEIAPSVEFDPRFSGIFPGNAFVGVPLVAEGHILGYVEAYRAHAVSFAEAAELARHGESVATALASSRAVKPTERLSRGRILIAEDDPATRMLLRRVLVKNNFVVIDVGDGRAACVEAFRQTPDLILIDWVMPVMDGREATRVLKSDPRTASVPIVMLTSQNEIDEKVLALEAGVQDFLSKPIDPRELVARIEQQLRWRKLLANDIVVRDESAPKPKASDPLPAIEPGGDLWLRAIEAQQTGKSREAVALSIAEAERCDSAKEYARAALAYRNASQLAGKIGNADLADKCLRLAGKMHLCSGESRSDPEAIKDAYLNASRCFIIAGNVKLAKKAIDIAQSMENIIADDRPSPIS